jgi:hypothetical protein
MEAANPKGDLSVKTSNLSSHDSAETRTWLTGHPRIHHVFIPTGARLPQPAGRLVAPLPTGCLSWTKLCQCRRDRASDLCRHRSTQPSRQALGLGTTSQDPTAPASPLFLSSLRNGALPVVCGRGKSCLISTYILSYLSLHCHYLMGSKREKIPSPQSTVTPDNTARISYFKCSSPLAPAPLPSGITAAFGNSVSMMKGSCVRELFLCELSEYLSAKPPGMVALYHIQHAHLLHAHPSSSLRLPSIPWL